MHSECTVKCQQRNICDFLKKVYCPFYKSKLGEEDKPWSPYKVCRKYEEDLRLWFKDKKTLIIWL